MERAPTDMTSALRGLLLDDRYRLEHVRDQRTLPDGRDVTLWHGLDVGLDRQVAVLVLSAATKSARDTLLHAATRASRITDGRCVRILDVGHLDGAQVGAPRRSFGWVASEWVDGPSLTAVLRRGPLRPPLAVELARQCTEALIAADRDGCRHGHLDPDEVLIAGGTAVRVTGIETATALAGTQSDEVDDVTGVGALLFAALTSRWPLPGWSGLPAPESDRRHPRASRSGVPREIDEVTARALAGAYPDLTSLARALRELPVEPLDAPEPPPRPGRSIAVRRWAWRVVPPVVVAAIAGIGWLIGSDLGKVPQVARAHHASLPPAAAAAPGTGKLTVVWTSAPLATSFDPEGDHEEDPDATGFAVDHDATTTWTTDRYRTAHFGGLKSGVGLLIDLGRPITVQLAELALPTAGADVELRAGDAAPSQASDLRLLATTANAGTAVSWSVPPTRARYWLIWFTNLPKVSGGYRAGITDISLLGPPGG